MKILIGHVYAEYSINTQEKISAWISRLRAGGFDVDSFCLSPTKTQPAIYWPELDRRWKAGDKKLLAMYVALARKLENYDVLLNYNGINLHPDFIQQLPCFKVYACFDDPESSEILSKPVAWAYDLAMIGNIAAVESYRQWGVKEVKFWPMGFRADAYDVSLTRDQILHENRDVDIVMLSERVNQWRKQRLDKFVSAFPNGSYYGLGWPTGFLPEEECIPLLRRSKIGINIHNSSGPINLRTYYLPANGVLQICDNKLRLGEIFELGKEVVGFDTIEEAIDLTKYYLSHEQELRQIAANGWQKAIKDYNEIAVFKRLVDAINEFDLNYQKNKSRNVIVLIQARLLKNETLVLWGILINKLQLCKSKIHEKSRAAYEKLRSIYRKTLKGKFTR